MKNMKKLFAILVAALMIVASMSALAAAGDLTADSKITITSLDQNDSVKLYQVFKWEAGAGWKLTDDFNVTSISGLENVQKILNPQKDQGEVVFTKADVEAIAAVASTLTTQPTATTVGSDKKFEQEVNPGMYLALITSATPGTLYNPIIVSADYTADNGTNTIPATSEYSGTAIAKKEPVTVTKEVDTNTASNKTDKTGPQENDIFKFTVKTTVPVFSKVYDTAYFTVSDTLDDYLDLKSDTIKVYKYDNETKGDPISVTPTAEAHSFSITFDKAYVQGLTKEQPILIEYSAQLNVPLAQLTSVTELDNDVQVEFPNNPTDASGKSVLKDETKQYTFSIDGSLFGNSDYQTGELVKVGKDINGSDILELIPLSNGSSHSALVGATFGLYTAKADADAANTNYYTNKTFTGTVTTDSKGLLKIDGLDAGTYYLKELTAPDGYIKDQKTYKVVITPEWSSPETSVTEYYTVDNAGNITWSDTETAGSTPYTYTVKTLKSYKVEIFDAADDSAKGTSTYTMTLDGPSVSTVTMGDSSTELVNTKGTELPSTGGMGTTLFYIGGAVLVLGAVVVMITRRRVRG